MSRRTWQWCHENAHEKKNKQTQEDMPKADPNGKSSLVDKGSPDQAWTRLQKTLVRTANVPGSQVQPQDDTSSHQAHQAPPDLWHPPAREPRASHKQAVQQTVAVFNTSEEREKFIFHRNAFLVRFSPRKCQTLTISLKRQISPRRTQRDRDDWLFCGFHLGTRKERGGERCFY